MSSHIVYLSIRLMILLLVLDQISIHCTSNKMELNNLVEFSQSETNISRLLEEAVNIPIKLNHEIVDRIRSIFKQFENRMIELRQEHQACEASQIRCFILNRKLEDARRNFQNAMNEFKQWILNVAEIHPEQMKTLLTLFDRIYNVFRDYVLNNSHSPLNGNSSTSTLSPMDTTKMPLTSDSFTDISIIIQLDDEEEPNE